MASGRAPLPPTGFGTFDASAVGRGSSGGGIGGGSGSGGGGGGGPRGAATTLVAERSEMRRWAQQLQRSRQVQRRSSRVGLLVLGLNGAWASALMAWSAWVV
eukprot:scaffold92021_cov36-Phaeocystis_antarctica.AAC.1